MLLSCVVITGPARAETINCTPITSLPAVITVQGIYCFTGHLNTGITSGNAIDIQTNNVVLDLNGFKLGGLAAGPGTLAVGIQAANRQNITLKNGTVRGFYYGILLQGIDLSSGHVIEDMRVDQNTRVGIEAQGTGHIIRNNQVVDTGGTMVGNGEAFGVVATGTGPRVLNNDVIRVVSQYPGVTWGIFLTDVAGGLVVNNRITQAGRGIHYTASTGKYRDNITAGVFVPYAGGTDAGNNN